MPKVKIELELELEQAHQLAVLDFMYKSLITEGPPRRAILQSAQNAATHLIRSAIDGVRRPGSWERSWLYQAFGNEFEKELERHPEVAFYQQPRAKR